MSDDFEMNRQKAVKLIEYILDESVSWINEDEFLEDILEGLKIAVILTRDILLIRSGSDRIMNIDLENDLRRLAEKAAHDKIMAAYRRLVRAIDLINNNTNRHIVFSDLVYGKQGGNLID